MILAQLQLMCHVIKIAACTSRHALKMLEKQEMDCNKVKSCPETAACMQIHMHGLGVHKDSGAAGHAGPQHA